MPVISKLPNLSEIAVTNRNTAHWISNCKALKNSENSKNAAVTGLASCDTLQTLEWRGGSSGQQDLYNSQSGMAKLICIELTSSTFYSLYSIMNSDAHRKT